MFNFLRKKKSEPQKEEAKQPMSLANVLAIINEQERIKNEALQQSPQRGVFRLQYAYSHFLSAA
ncbi:hypothetical protein O5962_28750, partial [Escherichia coli]|nr:hypothetical protein [Escherichia coli]